MMKSQLFYIYNYTMVKIRLFVGGVVFVVLFTLLYVCVFLVCFLRARYDHNKIAPCGMIKVFELN